jgi:DNA-binding CsgD family transcriptional regulator
LTGAAKGTGLWGTGGTYGATHLMRVTDDLAASLANEFGLTPAETDIVLRLNSGENSRAIADARASSIHTVRNQLKTAMTKLGVRRQVDVVRLVEGLRHKGK